MYRQMKKSRQTKRHMWTTLPPSSLPLGHRARVQMRVAGGVRDGGRGGLGVFCVGGRVCSARAGRSRWESPEVYWYALALAL